MRTIFVLRHGKSDWHITYGADHDRPLAKRGVDAAELMGRFLKQNRQIPAKVLSSTATRAQSTAELAIAAGNWDCPTDYTEALYGASVATVLEILQMESDELASLLLVGHQPTWSELIAELCGGAAVQLPTAALARIDLAVDRWRDVEPGTGALRWLVTPKLLRQSGFES